MKTIFQINGNEILSLNSKTTIEIYDEVEIFGEKYVVVELSESTNVRVELKSKDILMYENQLH